LSPHLVPQVFYLLSLLLIKMLNQYKSKKKVNMKRISKGMKFGWFSLHTSNHYIHMVDFISSNFMVAKINCSIKEFILWSNACDKEYLVRYLNQAMVYLLRPCTIYIFYQICKKISSLKNNNFWDLLKNMFQYKGSNWMCPSFYITVLSSYHPF
jgi:hypothetical protein